MHSHFELCNIEVGNEDYPIDWVLIHGGHARMYALKCAFEELFLLMGIWNSFVELPLWRDDERWYRCAGWW